MLIQSEIVFKLSVDHYLLLVFIWRMIKFPEISLSRIRVLPKSFLLTKERERERERERANGSTNQQREPRNKLK